MPSVTPAPERLIPLGEIVTTHGLEGWLRLNPYNPQTGVLSSSRGIILDKKGLCSTHEIEASSLHKGQFLLKLSRIDSIDDAVKWVGATLSVAEKDLQTLAPGEYYHYQVIGLEVFDNSGNRIGIVSRLSSTSGGEIYVVSGESREHLIPAVPEIIAKVDLQERKVIINPPEGLLEL